MVEINNLSFSYKKHSKLFEDLNVRFEAGKIYGLLGKNGAGKTSLLKIMMGMLFPKTGNCKVFGFEAQQRKSAMLADMMFVPEEFFAPSSTIDGYVRLYAGLYSRFDEIQFDGLLAEMKLCRTDKLKSLSLGQKKKAVLAFALAANTSVLILDEPTNGLDIPSKNQFRKMLAQTATENRCIIISTHQVRDIDKLIDTVVMLDEREIVLNKTLEEIAEKLFFAKTQTLSGNEIYAEKSLAGYETIAPNTAGNNLQVNLELLFNAILADKEKVLNQFLVLNS